MSKFVAYNSTDQEEKNRNYTPVSYTSTESFAPQQEIKQRQQAKAWTTARAYGEIYRLAELDPDRARNAYGQLKYLQTDPSSKYYDPYSIPTSQAVRNLESLGVNVSALNDDWFKTTTSWQANLIYNGTTNTPSKPGKKSTREQQVAYWLYKYQENESQTRHAEEEWARLQKNTRYWTTAGDRNLSDDDVIAKVKENFATDYPTLAKMMDNKLDPIQLNRAVDYSDDALRGVIWAARNDYDGDLESAMAYSYLGRGKQYQEDPAITAKLTYGSDEYSPYSVGSTMEKQRAYFGVDKFDRKWLEDNRVSIMGGDDETAKKYWTDVKEALDYTDKLNTQLSDMNKEIDYMISRNRSADDIINTIFENTEAYGDLLDLDDTMYTGQLKNTTDAVNYRRADIEAYIREKCGERDERPDVVGAVTGYITDTGSEYAAMLRKNTDREKEKQFGKGNIDLTHRPVLHNEDGTISTVESFSVGIDGKEVLLPSIIDGKRVSEDEAIQHYYDTGEYLGVFDTPEEATEYAEELHRQQEEMYSSKTSAEEELPAYGKTIKSNWERENKPFTEEQIAQEEQTARDMTDIASTVDEVGTEAEKAAIDTGKTGYYDQVAEFFRSHAKKGQEAIDSFSGQAERTAVGTYAGAYKITSGYEAHQAALQQKQERLAEIQPEYDKLTKKRAEQAAIASMTPDEYANLMAFTDAHNTNLDLMLDSFEKGPEYSGDTPLFYSYDQAVDNIYQVVTGKRIEDSGESFESAEEKVRLWVDYINRGEEDENEQARTLRENQERQDKKRYESLDREVATLNEEIQTEQDYLAEHESEYEFARRNRDFIKSNYQTALLYAKAYGKELQPELLDNIEFVFNQGQSYTKHQYSSTNEYDYYVGQERITREKASECAYNQEKANSNEAETIRETIAYLDRMGVELDDETRKNLGSYLDELDYSAKEASYVALQMNADFDDKAASGKSMAASGEYGEIAKAIATGEWHLTAEDYVLGIFGGSGNKALRDFAEMGDYLKNMNDDEKNRYFYLLKEDGQKAADDYFSLLTDPDKGALTIRRMEKASADIYNFASQPGINPYLASALGIAMSVASAPGEWVYRASQGLQGKEVSPYNSAYMNRVVSDAAFKGVKSAIGESAKQVFGEGSYMDSVLNKWYDIGVGGAKLYIGSKLMNELFTSFGAPLEKAASVFAAPDTLAVKMVKSSAEVMLSTLDSSEAAYRNTLLASGDQEKAAKMYMVNLVSGTLTHSVVMQGIHNAYQADPSLLTGAVQSAYERLLTSNNAIAASTFASSTINKLADKYIMEADGQWQKTVDKYKAMNYSQTAAEQIADQQMWEEINLDMCDAILTNTMRTGAIAIVGKTVDIGNKVAKKLSGKMERLWEDTIQPKIEVLKAKRAGTYTKDVSELGDVEGFTRFGSIANIPEDLADKIPEDAVLNPLNGLNGTQMFDRTTGKGHNIIAFTITDDGDFVYIDDNGEQIPLENIATQYGRLAENLTDDEWSMLEYGNQYRKSYQPKDTAGADTTGNYSGASPFDTESGTPKLTSSGETNWNDEQTAKDLSIITSTYGSQPTATAVGLSAVLNDPNPNASKAAGQALVADLSSGDPRLASAAMQGILTNTQNPAETKSDIVVAALTSGNGNAAMRGIVQKLQGGQPITAEDVQALHSGVQQDRIDNPDGIEQEMDANIMANRVANATVRIASTGEYKKRLLAAGKTALEERQKANEAKRFMTRKQDEAAAAAENLLAVEEQYDPATNPEAGGPLQQQTEKLMGLDVARQQAEDAYRIQQQKADEAQNALDETRNEVMAGAREEANVQTQQEVANEQAERDAQALRAAEAEQQKQALMRQEAEAEAADNNAFLEAARTELQKRGYTGEFADAQAQRMLERRMMLKRGEVNTDSMISEEDGEAFLRSISRQTGMTFSKEDLGDPLVFRGYINNRNDIVLNSNLSKGQALVEAALHETMHGLEETGAYVPFAETALKILYKGDAQALDADILKKMREYAAHGKTLTIDGAKQEIVADYSRLNMANKKFIRKVVARGAGSETRNALGRSVRLLKGYNFKGASKRQADLYRKAERLYTEAIDERARMVKEGYKGHTGISQASITSAVQGADSRSRLRMTISIGTNCMTRTGTSLLRAGLHRRWSRERRSAK